MNDKQPNVLLSDAIKERARVYLAMYRELTNRYGETEAMSVMRSAIYEHGKAFGRTLTCFAPRDFAGLAEGFAKAPDNGATFSPDVRTLNDRCLEVQMMTCPLKEAWVEAGCSDEEICTLLHCASAVDEGTLDSAGFNHEIELWSPGKEGCCFLRITEATQP